VAVGRSGAVDCPAGFVNHYRLCSGYFPGNLHEALSITKGFDIHHDGFNFGIFPKGLKKIRDGKVTFIAGVNKLADPQSFGPTGREDVVKSIASLAGGGDGRG